MAADEIIRSDTATVEQTRTMQPVVELHSVTKHFRNRTVLSGVSFALAHREMVVVMGKSGSGKSTMLRVLAGLTVPDSGSVLIGGSQVMDGPKRLPAWASLSRRVGMIFQQYTLWPHMDVYDNLALGPRKVLGDDATAIRARAGAVLEQVGMASHLHSRTSQLSGGERQRVAIARALMMRPEVLLCDEITSALDPPVAHEVLGVLTNLRDQTGIACIIVTHDMAFAAKAAERVLFVEEGEIIDEGSPDVAFTSAKSPGLTEFVNATQWG